MGCILNIILFIFLFGVIIMLYVGTTVWKQIKQTYDMFRGTKTANTTKKRSQKKQTNKPPKDSSQKTKIFPKNQGEYVDFQEIP